MSREEYITDSKFLVDEGSCALPNSCTLYWRKDDMGGRMYWSDEVGGGIKVWSTTLVGMDTLLAAVTKELELQHREAVLKEENNANTK